MAEIINLRMARKAKARNESKAQADANRAQHGRSKNERKATEAEIARIDRVVDGAKRERPEDKA
ncbi:DUF4169 family protein [Novosphingobium sp. BL-8H]|uniref:DUF4169 family protein n=1 Tax=Novosphingobium sp. BL-8H TaxID=3127640 RepID=UPI00375835C1